MKNKNTSFPLLCFDFDGTIADSMPLLEKNAVEIFKTYFNLSSTASRQAYRQSTGLPFVQQVETVFPKAPVLIKKKAVDLFEKQKIKTMFEAPLFPEVIKVFKILKQRKHKIAISSSSKKSGIRNYCQRNKILELVDYVLGFHKGFEKGRDHFNYLMQKEKVNRDKIWFIGDSINDMLRAEKEGIYFVARLGPMFQKSDFKNYKTIKNLNGLLQLL